MKRRSFLTGSVGLAAATLAGTACSSDGGASSGGTADIQFVESLTNTARTQTLQGIIDEFQTENSDLKVNLVSPPTEQADSRIQQMLQAGSGIDVLEVRDITVGPFVNNDWLVDMSERADSWSGFTDLTPKAQTYSRYIDDKVYFIPYGFYGLSLFYRTDLIKEAGFDTPPASWEDLLTQARAIQDPNNNRYGYAFRGGKNSQAQAVSVIECYVGENLDIENAFKTVDGATIFATPEAKAALELYLELFNEGSPPSSVSYGYPEMVEAFNNGSTAFLLQDPEVIATIRQSTALTEEQWNTTPLPLGPTGRAAQPVATAGWGIAASSEIQDQSWKLIEFLSGPASTTFAKENSLVPILQSAAEDPFYSSGPWESYVTMGDSPDVWLDVVQPRGVAWWSEWIETGDAQFQNLLLGDETVDGLLKTWDTFWTEKWAAE